MRVKDVVIDSLCKLKSKTFANTQITIDKLTPGGVRAHVKLYSTTIADLNYATKELRIYAGGYHSNLTKDRINLVLDAFKSISGTSQNVAVNQEKHVWWVNYYDFGVRWREPFTEGHLIRPHRVDIAAGILLSKVEDLWQR